MPETAPLIFKQERWFIAFYDLVLLIVIPGCIWMTLYIFVFYDPAIYTRHSLAEARIVCPPMFFFLCVGILAGRLYVADIHVDDDGIGWWAWGRRLLYLRWADVKTITIETIRAYNQVPPTVTSYCLYTTDKLNFYNSQKHGMRFDDNIPNAEALIGAVDRYVQQYNIVVLDRRSKPEARRSRL